MNGKVLFLGAANPLHNGHTSMWKILADDVGCAVEVYIGKRNKPKRLSQELRERTVDKVAQASFDHVTRIDASSHFAIDPSGYDGVVFGSDLFLAREVNAKMWEKLMSFGAVHLFQREGFELETTDLDTLLAECGTLHVHQSGSALQGSQLVEQYGSGNDIEQHIPEGTWEMIRPEAERLWRPKAA